MTFFVAMLLHPEMQKKVQDELDAVTGRERLPTFEDRPKLPYISAICKELLRWRPVVPLGTSIPSLPMRNIGVHLSIIQLSPMQPCETTYTKATLFPRVRYLISRYESLRVTDVFHQAL